MSARASVGLWWVLAVACGDDQRADPTGGSTAGSTAGSTTGSTANPTTDPTAAESTGGPGSTGTSPGSTGAVDGTTTGEGSSEETAIPDVFFPEVLAVIQEECFCHRSPMFPGQLDLRDEMAYDSLVSVPAAQAPSVDRVSPGDPGNSYLYLKLLGDQASVGGGGTRMPQASPMLPPDQLDLVRHWILGGAQP